MTAFNGIAFLWCSSGSHFCLHQADKSLCWTVRGYGSICFVFLPKSHLTKSHLRLSEIHHSFQSIEYVVMEFISYLYTVVLYLLVK